jgi:hypothetical protein
MDEWNRGCLHQRCHGRFIPSLLHSKAARCILPILMREDFRMVVLNTVSCNEGAKLRSSYLLRIEQMGLRPVAAIAAVPHGRQDRRESNRQPLYL